MTLLLLIAIPVLAWFAIYTAIFVVCSRKEGELRQIATDKATEAQERENARRPTGYRTYYNASEYREYDLADRYEKVALYGAPAWPIAFGIGLATLPFLAPFFGIKALVKAYTRIRQDSLKQGAEVVKRKANLKEIEAARAVARPKTSIEKRESVPA
jgi:hypothetical protein